MVTGGYWNMRERLSIYCICLYLVAQATFILSSSASPTGTSLSTTKGSGTEPLTSSATKLITAQPGSAVAAVVLAAQYKAESGSSSSVILPTVLAASGMVVLVILLIGLNLSSTFWSPQVDEENELEEGPSRLHTDTTFISASTVDLCA
ncbi:Cy156.2 [Cynomolgus cytomegalovirus]|nr:Cy156.2 [Cynomolgus cytomegalovirus]